MHLQASLGIGVLNQEKAFSHVVISVLDWCGVIGSFVFLYPRSNPGFAESAIGEWLSADWVWRGFATYSKVRGYVLWYCT